MSKWKEEWQVLLSATQQASVLVLLPSNRLGTTMLSLVYRGRCWSAMRLPKLLTSTEQRNRKTKLWVSVLLMFKVLIFFGSGCSLSSLSSVGPGTQALSGLLSHMKHFILFTILTKPLSISFTRILQMEKLRSQVVLKGVNQRFISWVATL